jgi:hypothetical protein
MPVPPGDAGAAPVGDRRMSDERRGEIRRGQVDRRVGEDRRSVDGRPTPASLLAALWEMPTVPEPEGLVGPRPSHGGHPSVPRHPPTEGQADQPRSTEPTFLDAEPLQPRATWPCAVCGTQNPLEVDTCHACGAPFSRLFQDPEARPDVEPGRAARYSLIFPGLGHAVAGRRAEGVARGILFGWCAATAILLLVARPPGGLGILAPMAIVFVLGSLVWYAVTALDAHRLASGDRQLVTSKIMLYSVAGLMMLSVGSVFVMVTRVSHVGH